MRSSKPEPDVGRVYQAPLLVRRADEQRAEGVRAAALAAAVAADDELFALAPLHLHPRVGASPALVGAVASLRHDAFETEAGRDVVRGLAVGGQRLDQPHGGSRQQHARERLEAVIEWHGAQVEAVEVEQVTVERTTSRRVRGGRVLVNTTVSDPSGRMNLVFFNQAWRERQLPAGTEAVLFGKVEDFRGPAR